MFDRLIFVTMDVSLEKVKLLFLWFPSPQLIQGMVLLCTLPLQFLLMLKHNYIHVAEGEQVTTMRSFHEDY